MRSSRRAIDVVVSDEEDGVLATRAGVCLQRSSRKFRRPRQSGFASPKRSPIARGGVACPFPWKLHDMLDYVVTHGLEETVAWDATGASFCVYDSRTFVDTILPMYVHVNENREGLSSPAKLDKISYLMIFTR